MKAAVIAMAMATGAAAAALAAPPAPAPERTAEGFDHIAHQGRVEARAVKPPACARCHATDKGGRLTGTPGHAACFGDCHGKLPARPHKLDDARRAVCVACHPPAQIDRLARGGGGPVRSAFPPYGPDGEFAVALSHAAHASVTGGCRTCHASPPEPGQTAAPPAARAGHTRCGACHARGAGGVAMSACGRCHTPAIGPVRAPHSDAGGFPVARRFSHRKHAARGAACATCHAGAAAATGDLVPTPKKAQCAACHDGKKAFSMVEPACRQCHAAPDREEPAENRRRAQFSHASHAASDCRTCHELDARGSAGPIGTGHRPCSDARCHASDFAARAPVTCTVCHARAEPWRDLHIDPQPAAIEFAVRFPHKTHRAPCASCHPSRPSGRFGRVAGHAACTGSTCHARSGGARPPLSECASCHLRGAGDARSSRQRRWSVRERFSHRKHLTEPSDAKRAVACAGCHTGLTESTGLADLPPPGKPTCARCHDGGAAFKLTGHSCNRCHSVAD